MLQHYELQKIELETMRKVNQIDSQIYRLALADYEAANLAPAQFLPKEKAWLEQGLNLLRKEMELKRLETDVLIFASSK